MSALWNNPLEGRGKRWYRLTTGSAALLFGLAVWANPDGVQVQQGQAEFARPDAGTLDITNSPGTILHWQEFSIQSDETTRFIQQSADSAVLNRVVGQDPSSLLGNLLSNGRVYLINRNGIVFGPDAVIDTAGLVASTLEMTDEDFLAGTHEFAGAGAGAIQNQGYLKAGVDGDIYLIAPNIENSGIIETDGGQLILAAGERVTLASLDSDHIVYEIEAPANEVLNLGELLARGGAAAIFAGTIKHEGAIRADSIRVDEQGKIQLFASESIEVGPGATITANGPRGGEISIASETGATRISGSIAATGLEATGGSVVIQGEEVQLLGASTIDVSGTQGGGEALLGGDYQGNNPEVHNAQRTRVAADVAINADATVNGDGGRVIVWSDESTVFEGSVSARGGAGGGDGGFVEISGKNSLRYRGDLDLSAAGGSPGQVLFDPKFILVANLGGPGISLALPLIGNDNFIENSSQNVTFDADDITAITNTGAAVTLQANTDITIDEPLVTSNAGAGGDLTLQAGRSVLINADIVTDNGALTVVANHTGAVLADRDAGLAEIRMADGATLNTGANNLTLNISTLGQSGDMVLENIFANDLLFRINGLGDGITGSSILRASNDALISGNSLFIDHDPLGISSGGSVGTWAEPLLIQLNAIAAHTHAASPGIFIDSPLQGVTVGGTFFGGFHIIQGLETVAGGDIFLNVNGTLTSAAGPLACGGSGGPICAGVGGDIMLSADDVILNTVVNATAGDVTIRPLNLFQNILIGGAGGLNLSPAELQLINANGVLTIGRTDGTGNLALATSVSSTDINATTLALAHGSILINNNLDFSAGNEGLSLMSPGFIQIINNSGAPFIPLTVDLGSGDLVIDGLGTGGFQLQGGLLDDTSTFVIADTITASNLDFLNVSGGSGLGSFATLNSVGLMDISVIDDLKITAYGVFTDSFAQLSSSGGQTIQAGYIEINSGPESISPAATGIFNNAGNQVITTTGQNLSNEGLVLMGTGEAVIKCTSGCTGQTITVNNADFVRMDAQPGSQFTQIFSDSTQAITLQGTGLNTLLVGSGGAQGLVEIVSIDNQTIKAGQSGESGSITVQAGSTTNPSRIQTSGSQTIAVQDDFMVIGGSSGAGGALAEIFAFGGLQKIDAGNLFGIQGGAGGTGNDAKVNGNLGATITAADIQVMGGDGGRALIDTIGAAQVITAANSILVQGANGGDGNGGEIVADQEQTVTAGAGGIALVAGTGMVAGNPAVITQLLAGFNQTIAAPGGTIQLTGGSDFGLALINGTGTTQTITADTLILEMPASGAANDSAARIDGNAQYITVTNGLFIQNPNSNAVDTSTEIEGFGSMQDIEAGFIEIYNASGAGAMIEQNGPGPQIIATTGANTSGEGLVIEDDGAGLNSFAGILCLGPGFGGGCNDQQVTVADADIVRILASNPASGRGAGIHVADTGMSPANQTVHLSGGGLNLLEIGDSANASYAVISADGPNQTIIVGDPGESGSLYIFGGDDDNSLSGIVAGMSSGNTAQNITVQKDIIIVGGDAPVGNQGAGIFAFGEQSVTAGADGILMVGGSNSISGTGNSAIIEQSGSIFNQVITLNNGGSLSLLGGDGFDNNQVQVKSAGSQQLTVDGGIMIFGGGTGTLNNVLIEAATTQTIAVNSGFLVYGGSSGVNNDTRIRALGGLQDINVAGGFQILGGFGGNDNGAFIKGDQGAQITADFIAINGGMGIGNEAEIDTRNALQTITATDGILLQGGPSGDDSFAGIFSDSGSIISAGPSGISLIGGDGTGPSGNSAVIEQQGVSSSLTLTLNDGGDLSLTGGAGGNFNGAGIRSLAGDIIIQTGTGSGVDLNLVGGTGAGSSNNFAFIGATDPAGNDILIDIDGNLSIIGGSEPTGFNNFAEIISNAGDIAGKFGGSGIVSGGPGQEASADIDAGGTLDLDFGGSLDLIGGDGQDARAGLGASTVLLDSGELTITGGNGVDALAGIGIDDGPIVVVIGESAPINGDVNLTGGSATGAFAGIGTNCLSIGCNTDVSVNAGGSVILQNGTVGVAAIGNFGGDPGVIDITAAMLGAGDILLNDGILLTNDAVNLTITSGPGGIIQGVAGMLDIGNNLLTVTTQGGAIDLPSLNNFYGGINVTSNGGPVSLVQAGNLVIDGLSTGTGLVTIIAAGSITQNTPILADYLSLLSDSFIDLSDPANAIAQIDATTTNPGGSVNLVNSIPLVVNGLTTADGNIGISNTGALTIAGPVDVVGTVTLQSSNGPLQINANITAPGLIDLSTSGTGSDLVIGTGVLIKGLTPGGDIQLGSSGNILLDGAVESDSGVVMADLTGNLLMGPAAAARAVTLIYFTAGGNLVLSVLEVEAGPVQLSADGMISDANGGADNILAGQLLVTSAGGGFGSLADPLEVQASNVFIDGVTTGEIGLAITGGGPTVLSGLNATSSQPVFITSTGLLNLNAPFSVTGSADFQANGILVSVPLLFGGDVDFDAGIGVFQIGLGGSVTAGGAADLSGADIFLDSLLTDIDAGSFPVTINTTGAVTAPIGTVPDIIASNLSINAANGVDLLVAVDSLTVSNTTAGAVTIRNLSPTLMASITNTGRPVTLQSTGGLLTLGAIEGSIVNLQGNAIADGNGAALNVTAGSLFYTAPTGFGSFTDPLETQVANLAIPAGTTSGDIGIINSGNINFGASMTTSGDINLVATGGTLQVSGVMIGAQDIRLSGATVQVGGATAAASQVNAAGNLQVVDTNNLTVRGSDTVSGGFAKLVSAGNVNITNVIDVTIQGGNANFANAGIDPVQVSATITGNLVLQAGGGNESEAQISATSLVDLQVGGEMSMTGGAGGDAHTVINAVSGNVVLSIGTTTSPADLVLTAGSGSNSDAVILANSGTGTVTINAAACTGCDDLNSNPLLDSATQVGVFADLILNAIFNTGESIPGNEQVIVLNDLQEILSGGDEEFLREMGILDSEEEDEEEDERTLLECR